MSTYHTIKEKSEALYKEKGSKFLAFAYPVKFEEDIKEIQESLRKEYYDARHHCFAWVLGMDEQSYRSNDDGEPAHSAGDPILGQIRSFELTNILVVVIRYFGGTKLGVGGLINAYKTATEAALSKAKKKTIYKTNQITMNFSYDMMSVVERIISEFHIDVIERDFQMSCKIKGVIKNDLLDGFREKTSDLYTIEFEIE